MDGAHIFQDYAHALLCLPAAVSVVWKPSLGPVIGWQEEAECRCLWANGFVSQAISPQSQEPQPHGRDANALPGIVCIGENVEQDLWMNPGSHNKNDKWWGGGYWFVLFEPSWDKDSGIRGGYCFISDSKTNNAGIEMMSVVISLHLYV